MLRSKFLIILILFSWLMPNASFASHDKDAVMPVLRDPWVPWPWALALPFPWDDIQGLWKAEDGDFVSYFAFKVVCDKPECKCEPGKDFCQLKVRQYDSTTCRLLADGAGIESTHKVLAQMTSMVTGMIYRVDLTSFSEKDSPLPPLKSDVPIHGVMVISIGEFNVSSPDEMVHMQIRKISANQYQRFCVDSKNNKNN
ncbi:MAG: hypothetical protein ACXVCP_14890 [Bdellovibrio sp.]